MSWKQSSRSITLSICSSDILCLCPSLISVPVTVLSRTQARMGQIHPREVRDEQMKRIVDHVFEYFSGHSGNDRLNFHELYAAVLLVYNDINKHFPGPHYDPPTREEVQAMVEIFDTNNDGFLDREEFARFIEKFTSRIAKKVGRTLLIFAIAAPALAIATKRATEGVPHVGKFVRRVPNGVYASLVTAIVLFLEKRSQKEAL